MGNTHVEYYVELRGDTKLALTPDTVKSFHCTDRESNVPDIFRSGVSLTRFYTAQVCELFDCIDKFADKLVEVFCPKHISSSRAHSNKISTAIPCFGGQAFQWCYFRYRVTSTSARNPRWRSPK